jgi:hypothetical protein
VKDIAIQAGSMDGNHLVVMYSLSLNTSKIPTHALIDYVATGYSFMDQDFANHYELLLYHLKTYHALEVING